MDETGLPSQDSRLRWSSSFLMVQLKELVGEFVKNPTKRVLRMTKDTDKNAIDTFAMLALTTIARLIPDWHLKTGKSRHH